MITRPRTPHVKSYHHAIALIDEKSRTCTRRKISNSITLVRERVEGGKGWARVHVFGHRVKFATITPDDIAAIQFPVYPHANDYGNVFHFVLTNRKGTQYVIPPSIPFQYSSTVSRKSWPHREPLMMYDLKERKFLTYKVDPVRVDVPDVARAWRAHVSHVFAQFRVHAALDMHKNIDRRKPNADGQDDMQLDWTSAALYKAICDSDMHKLMLFALHHGMHFQGCNVSSKRLVRLLTSRYNSQRVAIRLQAGAIALEQVNNGS